ncbi:hypothetical protein [Hymenobacter antarcticus]|uniref:Uncharacterized protein n=1 Tax=Hymenobacter antarcticus TaxID=486270 RepID=A0ABP7Q189_9BACT
MAKDKKKNSKKEQVTEDLLDVARASLKKFRKVTREISRLSTGQKLVGGLALAAAGLTYLATLDSEATPAAAAPAVTPPSDTDKASAASAVAARPRRKSPKA